MLHIIRFPIPFTTSLYLFLNSFNISLSLMFLAHFFGIWNSLSKCSSHTAFDLDNLQKILSDSNNEFLRKPFFADLTHFESLSKIHLREYVDEHLMIEWFVVFQFRWNFNLEVQEIINWSTKDFSPQLFSICSIFADFQLVVAFGPRFCEEKTVKSWKTILGWKFRKDSNHYVYYIYVRISEQSFKVFKVFTVIYITANKSNSIFIVLLRIHHMSMPLLNEKVRSIYLKISSRWYR